MASKSWFVNSNQGKQQGVPRVSLSFKAHLHRRFRRAISLGGTIWAGRKSQQQRFRELENFLSKSLRWAFNLDITNKNCCQRQVWQQSQRTAKEVNWILHQVKLFLTVFVIHPGPGVLPHHTGDQRPHKALWKPPSTDTKLLIRAAKCPNLT